MNNRSENESMASTSTLTSLAMLSVYVNEGLDYLEFLRPFILQVLIEQRPDPVKSNSVSDLLLEHFGLQIPYQTVELVLKRISRDNAISKENHIYRISGEIPDPRIATNISSAKGQIDSVVNELISFSQTGIKPFTSFDLAVEAICRFLASFDVTCLRAALSDTAIPKLEGKHTSDIVQVSEFVQHLQRSSPTVFQNFSVLLQGNMAANALLCPDLHDAPPTFENVGFYLDTPLLIPLLGLEEDSRRSAMLELIELLKKLGGMLLVFSHTLQELYGVVASVANYLNSTKGRGPIVIEARKRGTGRAELLLFAEKLEEELAGVGVHVEETPRYEESSQIGESVFEDVLKDEVKYYNNPNAIVYDINSVRSIYALRGNMAATSLEKASAVLVTSNSAFAKAAWNYGQQYESSQDVSVAITDFSLANLAWLKAPMRASNIPKSQLLAFSYAALVPNSGFLDKFMAEINRLESKGEVSVRDLQLLRSSPQAIPEVMHLTLGEDKALTGETLIQTINRVTQEIKKEEAAKTVEEQEAHRETQASLSMQVTQNKTILDNIYRRCLRNARIMAGTATTLMVVVFLVGLCAEITNVSSHLIIRRIIIFCSAVYLLLSAGNMLCNFNFLIFHNGLQKYLFNRLLQREAKAIGVPLSDFDSE